jgi:hypothetical protein
MFGRIASIDADTPESTSRSRRVWPPFMWKTIPDTRVRIAEDLGAAPAPLVLA